jgi:hypothetical protein
MWFQEKMSLELCLCYPIDVYGMVQKRKDKCDLLIIRCRFERLKSSVLLCVFRLTAAGGIKRSLYLSFSLSLFISLLST